MAPIVVATFYHFVALPDAHGMRSALETLCRELALGGTILIAEEGINGTIAGPRTSIDALHTHLQADERFRGLKWKEALAPRIPFDRLKIRLRSEIITLGVPDLNPAEKTGIRVEPQDWNGLLNDPEVILIDTRNQYEVDAGTFQGAIDPHLESFGDFPRYVQQHLDPQKHAKVAMFCTGGIRCEKASALLLAQGFEQVYQLQGGILNYLAQVPPDQSLWQGECFVFDQRGSVNHDLEPHQPA